MPNFYSKGGVKVEFRVVRAYITSEDVRKKTGIVANFSAKTIIHPNKGEEFVAMSHNALTLTVSRENHLYVSSNYEQHTIMRNGRQTLSPKVFYFSLLPGSDQANDTLENYDKFVADLADEIRDFVVTMRDRFEKRAQEPALPLPKAAQGLASLSQPKLSSSQASNTNQDIPF